MVAAQTILLGKQNDSSQLVLDVSGLSDKQINAIKNIAEAMKEEALYTYIK